MWMMTKDGFYSIVKVSEDPDTFAVRSRDINDLVAWCRRAGVGAGRIIEDRGPDYPFEVEVRGPCLQWWLRQSARGIDYENFKAVVGEKDPWRSSLYSRVWSLLKGALGYSLAREGEAVLDVRDVEMKLVTRGKL